MLRNSELWATDILSEEFEMPKAKVYFIYDFSTVQNIEKLLERILTIGLSHPVKIIGRGRAVRDCIERKHFWLTQIVKPQHFKNFSIYASRLID